MKNYILRCRSIFLLVLISFGFNVQAEALSDKTINTKKPDEVNNDNIVIVNATRSLADLTSIKSTSASHIETSELTFAKDTINNIILSIPSVSESGKGGLFQVISIRGISGHRILNIVEGIPIFSDRRAGTSLSFIDPLMIASIDVISGPVSTWYGSGALGGVINVFTSHNEGLSLDLGYLSQGDQQYFKAGYGEDNFSIDVSRRSAVDSYDVKGTPLNTGFNQTGIIYKLTGNLNSLRYQWFLSVSRGKNIGKSEIGYPEKTVTNYPNEQHNLGSFSISNGADWQAKLFFHDNTLTTERLKVDQYSSTINNRAFDYGAQWQQLTNLGDDYQANWGLDWLTRNNVNANEVIVPFSSNIPIQQKSLSDAQLLELATFASILHSNETFDWQIGLRYTWQQQKNAVENNIIDHSINGFIGFRLPLTDSVILRGNMGTGVRFPTLSERFYTGTTGRGQVLGNPNLKAESSQSFEIGIEAHFSSITIDAVLYRQLISNYIERYTVSENIRSYLNLTKGTIDGIDATMQWFSDELGQISLSLMLLKGTDGNGKHLTNIPSFRYNLAWSKQINHWLLATQFQYRLADNKVGTGEKEINSVLLFDAALSYQLGTHWSINIQADNLLNQSYFANADEDMTLSQGRRFGISVRYQY